MQVFLFASCSTRQTPYQPLGNYGGFEELQLSENIFSVRFQGNSKTRKQKSIDFCLLRCAEVCLQNKYGYFAIINQVNDTKEQIYSSPASSISTGTINTLGQINLNTTNYGGQTYITSSPSTSNTIICFKAKPPNGIYFDADFLLKKIGEKYGISLHPNQIVLKIKGYGKVRVDKSFKDLDKEAQKKFVSQIIEKLENKNP